MVGLVSYRLVVCKDSKKVGSKWKVWFDNALHDPPDLASDLKRVTLLPLVQQGPHNGLTEGMKAKLLRQYPTGTQNLAFCCQAGAGFRWTSGSSSYTSNPTCR